MKYDSKPALLADIRTSHDLLQTWLAKVSKSDWNTPGVWGDSWTVTDLVSHLAEWQEMFLRWYEEGLGGATPRMPAPGFTWRETPRLNRAIRQTYRGRSPAAARLAFDTGHQRIVDLVETLTPRQLLTSGQFAWTGKNSLVTYLGANSASHYRFATKILKRWLSAREESAR